MRQLENERVAAIQPLLDTPIFRLVGSSIILGLTPARVWVDDPLRPNTVLANEGRNVHLSGATDNDETNRQLAEIFANEIAPECRSRGISFFKLHYSPEIWSSIIDTIFGPLEQNVDRRIYCALSDGSSASCPPVPTGFALRQIDQQLLDSKVGHLDLVFEEILGGWLSIDTFLERGFGFAMLHGTSVVCWCTSEYVSEERCGMGIETVEDYQGRGIATTVGAQVAKQAKGLGLRPYWDCWEDNKPSIRVAEKLGFTDPYSYKIAFGKFE